MSKRSHSSASKGKPILKKARRESEVESPMPKVVPLIIEEQGGRRRGRGVGPEALHSSFDDD